MGFRIVDWVGYAESIGNDAWRVRRVSALMNMHENDYFGVPLLRRASGFR